MRGVRQRGTTRERRLRTISEGTAAVVHDNSREAPWRSDQRDWMAWSQLSTGSERDGAKNLFAFRDPNAFPLCAPSTHRFEPSKLRSCSLSTISPALTRRSSANIVRVRRRARLGSALIPMGRARASSWRDRAPRGRWSLSPHLASSLRTDARTRNASCCVLSLLQLLSACLCGHILLLCARPGRSQTSRRCANLSRFDS